MMIRQFDRRRRIDPTTLVSAERPLFVVVRDDVLPKLGSNRLKAIVKLSDDRKVAKDGMPALH